MALLGGLSCAGTQEVLYVGPELRTCFGVFEQQCYLVRRSPAQNWEYFYDPIQGFYHEPGYTYTLLVRKTKVENPLADASSLRWRLIRILDRVPAL